MMISQQSSRCRYAHGESLKDEDSPLASEIAYNKCIIWDKTLEMHHLVFNQTLNQSGYISTTVWRITSMT